MEIQTVGVVGGGTMGAGIIQTLSRFGYPVYFKEVSDALVKKCIGQVEKIYLSALKKGKLREEDVKKGLSLIHGGVGDEGLYEMDLVIEAVPERMEIKQAAFQTLDKVCKPNAILASNTSSFSITEIGNFTSRTSHVVGMHWFNPPHVMKLIEIIPGIETSDGVVECLTHFCQSLEKIPVRVKECAGFLVNRLLGMYVNEALFMVEEGEEPVGVDQAALSLGIPMGPLRLGDMVGWDIIYHSNRTLYEEYGSRFLLPKVLVQMVGEGRLGVKSGLGIYTYGAEKSIELSFNHDKEKLNFLSNRLLFPWMNEGIRCLEEGVATLGDIDLALQIGAGMPKGPLVWADEVGLDVLLQELEIFKARYGERFWPSPFLRKKVRAGHLGKKSGIGFFRYSTGY